MNIRPVKESDIPELRQILALWWTDKDFVEHLVARLGQAVAGATLAVTFFVAEENPEVLGVAGFRKIPDHMASYAKTSNSAELYLLAAKNQRKGIGKALVNKILDEAKNSGYTEIVLFSPESLKESWTFYDHIGFERVSPATAPNGEPGHVWSMHL